MTRMFFVPAMILGAAHASDQMFNIDHFISTLMKEADPNHIDIENFNGNMEVTDKLNLRIESDDADLSLKLSPGMTTYAKVPNQLWEYNIAFHYPILEGLDEMEKEDMIGIAVDDMWD